MNTLRLNEIKLNIKDEAEWQTVYDNQRARVERELEALEKVLDFGEEQGYIAEVNLNMDTE